MTAVIVAAVAGVLGIMVGRLWDTRSESTRWRRDQKTGCYQRLAEQFQTTYEAIRAVARADTDADSRHALIEHTRNGVFPSWDSAVASVWLHGSLEVVMAATLLDEAIGELHDGALRRQIVSQQDWDRARDPARRAFECFLAAARRELDLAPVGIEFPVRPEVIDRSS
ncbi:hypothetical protein ABZ511_11210 [Nocardia gamkensis]|uniref:hypothetical protein n=1 Tax=Nocardia gamkensis TaxID=352869 RepID=UPI003408BDCC